MPLKVTRRPYTSCPFRWLLVIKDMATGEGDVTDATCESLNGVFRLDYKACYSTGPVLVWASPCLDYGHEIGDKIRSKWYLEYRIEDELWTLRSFNQVWYPIYSLGDSSPCSGDEKTLVLDSSGQVGTGSGTGGDGGCADYPMEVTIKKACPPERRVRERYYKGKRGKFSPCGCDCQDEPDDSRFNCVTRNDGGDNEADGGCADCCPCYQEIEWAIEGLENIVNVPGFYSPSDGPRGDVLTNCVPVPGLSTIFCSYPAETICTFSCAWADFTYPFPCHPSVGCWQEWTRLLSVSCDSELCVMNWTFTHTQSGLCYYGGGGYTATYTGQTPLTDNCGEFPITLTKVSSPHTGWPSTLTFTPTGSNCEATEACGTGTDDDPPDFVGTACEYPEGSDCCDYCSDQDPPCAYIADFGCDINYEASGTGTEAGTGTGFWTSSLAAANVTLRHICYFENPCQWAAVGPVTDDSGDATGLEPTCASYGDACLGGCTWETWVVDVCTGTGTGTGSATNTSVIEAYGTSWELEVSGSGLGSTLTYQHPEFGLLQYAQPSGVPWLCDNTNTMTLTSQGSLPDGVLPIHVCVKPFYSCYDVVEDCGFETAAKKCACCDPCCDCIPQHLFLQCGDDFESCEGLACTGGRDGLLSPDGPSREMCCFLLGNNVCAVWYCSGGQWLADVYCEGVLCQAGIELSHECCPLVLGSGAAGPCCPDCEVCVGPDCEPDPGVDTCCCEGIPIPFTLTLSDGTNSITLTNSGGLTWTGTGDVCGCNGTWTLTGSQTGDPGCGTSGCWSLEDCNGIFGANAGDACSPLLIEFNGFPGCTSVTITA